MSDNTGIEWTDATWNPVTGCTEVSPGCDHCYAKTFAERFRGTEGHYFENGFDIKLRPDKLDQPLRWQKPRRVFVNSMSDLFHDDVPPDFIAKVFAIMTLAPQHTFQVLTKRHARMRSLLNADYFRTEARSHAAWWADYLNLTLPPPFWPLPNVWMGVSTENQQWADIRIPALLDTPAAVRFISAEPLLGEINLKKHLQCFHCKTTHRFTDGCDQGGRPISYGPLARRHIDWVIVGGESGHGARIMSPDWARDIRDQCQAAGVPFLFKQWGEWAPINDKGTLQRIGKKLAGRELDGRTWDQYPESVTA
jgi:protein gp37